MKRIITLCIVVCASLIASAQTDSTAKAPETDTIRIGNMVIIRKQGTPDKEIKIRDRRRSKPSNINTNWWILDLGFSNFKDETVYTSPAAQAYAPGSNKGWFDLKDGKSRNVNIWVFMQRLNLVSHVVNLKYGLGVELNNYRYKQPIRYQENVAAIPNPPRVLMDMTTGRTYEKNKLAADYVTVPMMLNINFTPNRNNNGFGLSAGISAGYLYSARNKTITSDEGKKKAKDDFELEKWKLSYIAELSLGPVRFYGSYAMKNMYERGLDMTPYNFGIRFSNW
jgi:hypothetical protein